MEVKEESVMNNVVVKIISSIMLVMSVFAFATYTGFNESYAAVITSLRAST